MHCRFYTLQTMHKVAEQAQSQASPPLGKQHHCTGQKISLHGVCCELQSKSFFLFRSFELVPHELP